MHEMTRVRSALHECDRLVGSFAVNGECGSGVGGRSSCSGWLAVAATAALVQSHSVT